jgi:ribosome-associated translation inhibitor RaiA
MHETLNSGIAPPALIRVNDKRPPAVSHLHDRKQDVAMAMNVEASFWGMQTSLSAEAQLRERAAELEQLSDRISACRVMLEATHRHHRSGTIYCVSADLALRGGKIVANREPGKDHAREDMHVAIRDAFDAARRRLQDHRRRMEGEVKESILRPQLGVLSACSPIAVTASWSPMPATRSTCTATASMAAVSTA